MHRLQSKTTNHWMIQFIEGTDIVKTVDVFIRTVIRFAVRKKMFICSGWSVEFKKLNSFFLFFLTSQNELHTKHPLVRIARNSSIPNVPLLFLNTNASANQQLRIDSTHRIETANWRPGTSWLLGSSHEFLQKRS